VPRVAVIVPIYNGERYLAEAIESIVDQTYGDWEAVLVDDSSTDGSYQIAASFADAHPDKIAVHRLDRNVGVAEARNKAIAASRRGELIALLDHDDYWRSEYLERSVALFDEVRAAGRRVGIVGSNAFILTSDGGHDRTIADVRGWPERVDYDAMIQRNQIPARAMFTRAAYEEAGGFSSDCIGSDDYDLWLRMMEADYEVVATPEPLAVYRHHPGGFSRNRVAMSEATLSVYRRALERGALTARQRRRVKACMRHYRALRARALVREAAAEGRPLRTALRAAQAAPYGSVAFLQDPSRWREWLTDLLGRGTPAGAALPPRRTGDRSLR
jgi:glycosyltransferase involved in cell wall biosynthesis